MGLCPGAYGGTESVQTTIYIAETAFLFLEPSIRKYSAGYARNYSHWGVTEILRSDWENIIQDWKRLRSSVAMARTVHDVGSFCAISKEIENEFKDAFEVNKNGLLNMIDQLTDWFRAKLTTHAEISVIGI